MKRKPPTRRARSFRRGMVLVLSVLVVLSAYAVYAGRRGRLPEVRAGVVSTGDVVSYMNITATLRPANIQSTTIRGQLVKEVLVERGERVSTGQLLVTFDLAPQEKAYADAVAMREKTEIALADATRVAQEMQAASAASALESARQLAAIQASLDSVLATFEELNESLRRIEERLDDPAFTLPSALPTSPTLPSIPSLPSFPSLPSLPTASPTPSPSLGVPATGLYLSAGSVSVPPAAPLYASSTPLSEDLAMLSALGLAGSSGDLTSQIQSLLGTAQSAQAQALLAEENARAALDGAVTEIRADFSGVVAEINAKPGETTPAAASGLSLGLDTSTDPTVTIYDDVRLRAVFYTGRTEAGKLGKGMPVEFVQDGTTYEGTILTIAGVATGGISTGSDSMDTLMDLAGTGTQLAEPSLEVVAGLSNHRPGTLLIGFPIDARIRTAERLSVVRVPSEAMKKELGEYYVFSLTPENRVRKVFIGIGIQSDTHAEVVSGLAAGDRVVLNPASGLEDGDAVRIKPETP